MTTNVALLGGGLFAQGAYANALSQPSNTHINLHTIWSRSESSANKVLEAVKEKGLTAPRVLFGDDGLQKVCPPHHAHPQKLEVLKIGY